MSEEPRPQTEGKPAGDGPTAITKAPDKLQTFRDLFQKYRANFAAVLPQTFKVEKLLQVALAAVGRDNKLASCTPASVLRAVMTAAQLGLDPSGVLGSGYLVPFWNSKLGRFEAVFIAGYRGLIDLARRSGEVTNVEAHVVYGKDQFEYRLGLDPLLNHVPSLEEDPGPARCAYVIIRMKDSPVPLVEIMSFTQIEAIRKRSRAGQEGPWVDAWHEMARKTVTRRGLKYAPLSVEAARAIAVEDRIEVGDDVSDLLTLPELDEGPGNGEGMGTKSDRLADRLKDAKAKAAEATATGGGKAAPTPEPAPAPPTAPEPAAPGAREAGRSEDTPTAETKTAGPGPGWPLWFAYAGVKFEINSPAELEAFQEQCVHPAVTPTGVCQRCHKAGVLKLAAPAAERPRRAR